MRRIFVIVIFFLLTACTANQVIPTPAVTVTFTLPAVTPSKTATVEKPTPTRPLPPTETAKFTAENVGIKVIDKESMAKCPLTADPLKDSLDFQNDAFSMMSLAEKELFPNYKGKYITVDNYGAFSNGFNQFELRQDMPVIGCYRFPVEGNEDGLGLMVPALDSQGPFIIFVMVDPTLINMKGGNWEIGNVSQRRTLSEVLDLLKAGNGIVKYDGSSLTGIQLLCEPPAGGTLASASEYQKSFFKIFGAFGGGLHEWSYNANSGKPNIYVGKNRPTFTFWDFYQTK